MAGHETLFIHTPVIFIALCYACATAIYFGIFQWARMIAYSKYHGQTSGKVTAPWIAAALITVILSSLSRQLVFAPSPDNPYWPEILMLILLSGILGLGLRYKKKVKWTNFHLHILAGLRKIVQFCMATLCLWIAGGLLFFSALFLLSHLSQILPARVEFNPIIFSTFLLGAALLAPLVFYYYKAHTLAKKSQIPLPAHYKFHHILWPFILALLLIILPLILDHLVASGKIEEMMNTPMPLQRV